jgi:hypothetical protein
MSSNTTQNENNPQTETVSVSSQNKTGLNVGNGDGNNEIVNQVDDFNKEIEDNIASYENKLSQFEKTYKSNTEIQHKQLTSSKNAIAAEIKEDEENRLLYKKEKNKVNMLENKIKEAMYNKNVIGHEQMTYMGITSIHLFAIIIVVLAVFDVLNSLIALIVIIIIYTFIVVIFYYNLRGGENRNIFDFHRFDTKYDEASCKNIQGASRGDVKKRELKEQTDKKTTDIVKRIIRENEPTKQTTGVTTKPT